MPHTNVDLGDPQSAASQPLGWILRQAAQTQFNAVRGAKVGIGQKSCDAALAIAPTPGYDTYADASGGAFSVIYGNSRIYTGLDPDTATLNSQGDNPFSNSNWEQHAEQIAIRAAQNLGLALYVAGGHRHVWTTFAPCDKCDQWYRGLAGAFITYYG